MINLQNSFKCNICNSTNSHQMGVRVDTLKVVKCDNCGMGVLANIPRDTSVFYQAGYYSDDNQSQDTGYSNYDQTSEHGVIWAVELLKLMKDRGKVLDIGCANGFALEALGDRYERYGIEASIELSKAVAKRGITILGNDLLDSQICSQYAEHFDAITAIAVFEHISDFRTAVENSLAMLKHDGVLLFEIPLMSTIHSNETWLKTSLEHVYYPTLTGIFELFKNQLEVQLVGRELNIRNYASNFIGIVTKNKSLSAQCKSLFDRLMDEPIEKLNEKEQRVHLLLHIIHAATPNSERLKHLNQIVDPTSSLPYFQRIIFLWQTDRESLNSAKAYLVEVQAAGLWQAQNAKSWQTAHEQSQIELTSSKSDAVRLAEETTALIIEAHRVGDERKREFDLISNQMNLIQAESLHLNSLLQTAKERLVESDQLNLSMKNELSSALSTTVSQAEYIAMLSEQLEHDQRLIENFLSSTSWKITSPIRWVASTIKNSPKKLEHAIQFGRRLLNRKKLRAAVQLIALGDLKKISLGIDNLNRQTATEILENKAVTEIVVSSPLDRSQPLVSIVIPCFNYGRFVTKAVESILKQTLQSIEIIVVDGGSTDEFTREIITKLKRPKTTVYARVGRHLVGSNRNYGIERAKGRYICCLDADDDLDPTYLEKAVFLIETYHFDLVSTGINFVGDRQGTMDVVERPVLKDMISGNHVLTCALFRKSDWVAVGGYFDVGIGGNHVAEDWDFWLRIAARGARIRNISGEHLFNYRIHSSGSLSSAAGTKSLEDQKAAILVRNAAQLTENSFRISRELGAKKMRSEPTTTALANAFDEYNQNQKSIFLAIPLALVGGAERLISELCLYLIGQNWRITIIKTLEQDPAFGSSVEWFKNSTAEVYDLTKFLTTDERIDFTHYLFASRRPMVALNVGSRFFYEQLAFLKTSSHSFTSIDLLFNTIGHTESHIEFKQYIDFALAENQEVLSWYAEAAKWPKERIRLVTSGVKTAEIKPCDKDPNLLGKLNASADTLIIGFSGRLSEEKAPMAFLEIARLCQSVPNLVFVMTGAGPMAEAVNVAAKLLPPSCRFKFVGLVDNVYEYISTYDLLVLPSLQDGRPLVVMEALASGVPVIASAVGGLPELVLHGRTGFLIDPLDLNAFAEKIRQVESERSSLKNLKKQAREFAVEHLDSNRAFEGYQRAFIDALQYQ